MYKYLETHLGYKLLAIPDIRKGRASQEKEFQIKMNTPPYYVFVIAGSWRRVKSAKHVRKIEVRFESEWTTLKRMKNSGKTRFSDSILKKLEAFRTDPTAYFDSRGPKWHWNSTKRTPTEGCANGCQPSRSDLSLSQGAIQWERSWYCSKNTLFASGTFGSMRCSRQWDTK